MPLTVTLPPHLERKLRDRAAESGRDADAYATMILTDSVNRPTLDEVLEPFRRSVEESGMSDEELDEFFREELRQVRAERRQAARKRSA